ncbi:MAG: signal peptidase II, partial [Flavobacteriales bacterium]
DQILKIWVKLNFQYLDGITLIPGLLDLQFVENPGMAFGWALPGQSGKLFLSVFRIVVVIALGYYLYRQIKQKMHAGFVICVSLIVAGALGNIVDSLAYGSLFDRGSTYDEDLGDYTMYFGKAQVVDSTPKTRTEGFDQGLMSGPDWIINTGSIDTSSGYFGAARPSLLLQFTEQSVQSRAQEGEVVTAFQFWSKANMNAGGSKLFVECSRTHGDWVALDSLVEWPGEEIMMRSYGREGQPPIPDGVRAVRLRFEKGESNLMVDDITMETQMVGYTAPLMGNVVDMFHFTVRWPWGENPDEIFPPIFNVADASITLGIILILLFQRTFFPRQREEEEVSEPNPTSSESAS